MKTRDRYQIAEHARQTIRMLKLSPERVLRRAGLPDDYLETETRGVTPRQWFAVWHAIEAEYEGSDLAVRLGQSLARGPFVPAMFAFSCSANIEQGLQRLALFKPLLGPFKLTVERVEDAVVATYSCIDPDIPIPALLAQFEAVYFLEACRIYTGEHIIPLAVGRLGDQADWEPLSQTLGIVPEPADRFHLTFSLHDATLPLISHNEEMWDGIETGLKKKLLSRTDVKEMSQRVHSALLDALPSGQNTVDDICRRLHVSKRTLQRKLKDEGTTFQQILDETRSSLSHHYLKKPELSVVEISYLLGFQDPGSFYRAFHNWTGQTPADVRNRFSN